MTARILTRLAGAIWLAAGGMLAVRGIGLLVRAREEQGTGLFGLALGVVLGLGLGFVKGRFVLPRAARRNRKRIEKLEQPRIWDVYTWRFVLLIGAMIGLGVLLRTLAAKGWIGGFASVGGLYLGIGTALVLSAVAYFQAPRVPLATRREEIPPREGAGRRGLLVVNLGTPDAPTKPAVRRYLREFLGDPYVVEVNRALWAFVLNVIILPFRSGSSARLYSKIWTSEGSPLLTNSHRIVECLREELGPDRPVELGMRYGNPRLADALDELRRAGCDTVDVLQLFPQASRTTTGTVQAEVARVASARRDAPALSFIPSYHDDAGYIDALVQRVEECRGSNEIDHYVFSFHGLPEKYVRDGDPYLDECTRTAFLLAQGLGLARDEWDIVFQSRFGDEPWLQPYADEFVPALAATKPRILICVPGFAADCLETLQEIALELREDFLGAGGMECLVAPALNDHPRWIKALESLSHNGHVAGYKAVNS